MGMTGVEIRELRNKMALSQQDFSVIVGTTLHTISCWELGKHKPYRLAIEKLEKIKADFENKERDSISTK
jgi:DNA-binding transcriptional regulator YiaG